MELVNHIDAELSKLDARVSEFENSAQLVKKGDDQDEEHSRHHWRHHIKEKWSFVFSKPLLQDSTRNLKELLECLTTLRSQIETNEERRPLSRPSAQARQAIEQFALVQTASQKFYDALSLACTKHTHHQAQFSLQPISASKARQVRFSVGLRQVLDPASVSKQTVWFTVESIVKQSIEPCSSGHEPKDLVLLSRSVKRGRASSPSAPPKQPCKLRKPRKKSVQFQLPSMQSSSPLPYSLFSSSEPSTEPSLSNLCSRSNLCNQLQNFLSGPAAQSECCIGYLERTLDSKHLIYLKGRETKARHHVDVPSSSLAELLSQNQAGSDEMIGITQCERLRVSRKLATAVLQFYSTPWLRNSWSSKDVFFRLQPVPAMGEIEDLKEPYVDVSVRNPMVASNGDQISTCYPFAQNDFLFGLGVMLLELAFQKPLRSMQQPGDVASSQDERHTLFFTAKRMSRLVSAKSGTRYGEIVRKCLFCDFGRGDDLSKPALQEGVYREVVCELTELEELLRAMNIGP